MNLTAIAAAAGIAFSFFVGFGAAWELQQGKFEHAENTRLQQAAEDQQRIHALEQARSAQVIRAQDSHRVRQVVRATELDTANAIGNGLRLATDATVRDAQANPDACPDKAQSLAIVFAECRASVVQMAADADEWQSEYQLITESWPR